MICIYHNRDLDGWMSAAIVKQWFPQVKLIGWDYGIPEPPDEIIEFNEVILVDVTLSEEFMLKHKNCITWIDHHKSAIEKWSDANAATGITFPGLRDVGFAACELTWKFFGQGEMPEVVRLLGRYDCFGHKGTDEELKVLQFQYAARTFISSPDEALNALECHTEASIKEWLAIGAGIYSYLCTEAKQIYARRFNVSYRDLRIAAVNQERFNPINFGIDYHADGYDAFLCFYYNKGRWIISLYNDNGFVDCSEICKANGGGGHAGAAGFTEKSIEDLFSQNAQEWRTL